MRNIFRSVADLSPAKRTVALLVFCQALSMSSITMLMTVAAVIGANLTPDRSLSTLPIALLQLSVMLTTIPASLLMQRTGRRTSFLVGTAIGMIGAGLGIAAVLINSFPLFCLAGVLFGVFNSVAGFYRFAAADAAPIEFRAQAISLVVAGGVVAALLGPNLANWAKDSLPVVYAGSLVPILGLQLLTLAILPQVNLPPLVSDATVTAGRSLPLILKQPLFLVATLSSMVGYGVMVLLMTATPLVMVAVPHPFDQAALVIQWHVLGMFAPSFFTGSLIARFGVLNVMLVGVGFNLLAVSINLLGLSVPHFLAALTLLGVGWNFLFVGATTLLTQIYTPAEKAKTQAAHDFLMYTSVAIAAFLSGRLLSQMGWAAVNWVTVPGLLLTLFAISWAKLRSGPSALRSWTH